MALLNLVIVLGDQLDTEAAVFDGFEVTRDAVWMAEAGKETSHVWCHQQRIAVFLSAMRHFRDELRRRGVAVYYTELAAHARDDREIDHAEVPRQDLNTFIPQRLLLTRPGDYRIHEQLQGLARQLGIELEIRRDRHFYCSLEAFNEWAGGRSNLKLETFHHWMRRRHDILLEPDGSPAGGQWNYDPDNRLPLEPEWSGYIRTV